MKKLLQTLCLAIFFMSSSVLYAQQTQSGITLRDVIPWGITILIFIIGAILSVLLVKRKKKAELEAEMKFKEQEKYIENLKEELKQKKLAELEAQKEFDQKEQISVARTAEDIYRAALKEELGRIDLLGSPDIESKAVKLEDAFVSLRISESWRSENRFAKSNEIPDLEMERERDLTPAEVMTRAFTKHRLLLVIGDPGSGKTTLLKYYAVSCLNNKSREFGFKGDVFPIYFPLRELDFDRESNVPALLPQNLEKWSARHLLNISAGQFHDWLHKRKTLVLLDGLDEISSKEQRRKVCRWIKNMGAGLTNACFVVTSRSTGYRKLDGIELEMPHLRADIMDFSPEQQEVFLKKWFRAVCCEELQPKGNKMTEQEWRQRQKKRADQQAQAIIDFLKAGENKAVRDLAAVPMLLQIMAVIWKERKHLPHSRTALYDAALNYLLAYRDKAREIEPLLPVEQSRSVLAPTALWMQEDLNQDEAPKEQIHQKMQPILNTLASQPQALVFCEYLCDRTGLIADYDTQHYLFRHKSFKEFLAAVQLKEDSHEENRIETLVRHFKEDWWEETLRFFISKSNDKMFDRFMGAFFTAEISQELTAHQQDLLRQLILEAPQKRIDALKEHLNSGRLNNNQRRYLLDCLKTIGTPEAIEAIETADKTKMDKSSRKYAEDIIAEAPAKQGITIVSLELKDLRELDSFRNPLEDNVEYIKIPGGNYEFSVTKKKVTVPDLWFCKYPVTNKRYRRFISFLAGKEKDLAEKLPLAGFAELLLEFSKSVNVKGYTEYLGNNPNQWHEKLRSGYDENKKFNEDDQPVVDVSWYGARAYCFWLSCLEAVIRRGEKPGDVKRLAGFYRLPREVEWEWAAGGEPDGSMREYPWPKDKGEPNPNLANYGENVGATTPVGRYPEGATPTGLMDMAGNVWEWMENYYDEKKSAFSLRGGSWDLHNQYLRCSARDGGGPDGHWDLHGFRVLRAQSLEQGL